MTEITFEHNDGWTTRFVDDKRACAAPVDRVDSDHGWCEECREIAGGDIA